MNWKEWCIIGVLWLILLTFVIASAPNKIATGNKLIIDFKDAENVTGVAKLSCDKIGFRVTQFSLTARTGIAEIDSTQCAIIKGDKVE